MSRAAVGTFIAVVGAVLSEMVKAEAICLESDGVSDAVVGGALAITTLQQLLASQDAASNNLAEGSSELPDAVRIDEGVDHRVRMGENYGHIHYQDWRTLTLRTEESETVDYVQRQPAKCEQPDYDGQRLGSVDLFLQHGARLLPMNRLDLNQLELAASRHENAQVDGQHQHQRDQYKGKKVEVDHILHHHHLLKLTLHQARWAGAVVTAGRYVPAHHWGQTNADG